jgi:hypothetical protein
MPVIQCQQAGRRHRRWVHQRRRISRWRVGRKRRGSTPQKVRRIAKVYDAAVSRRRIRRHGGHPALGRGRRGQVWHRRRRYGRGALMGRAGDQGRRRKRRSPRRSHSGGSQQFHGGHRGDFGQHGGRSRGMLLGGGRSPVWRLEPRIPFPTTILQGLRHFDARHGIGNLDPNASRGTEFDEATAIAVNGVDNGSGNQFLAFRPDDFRSVGVLFGVSFDEICA